MIQFERINKMLEKAHTGETVFPPTTLYEEGWMLRITLNALSEGKECFPFPYLPGARWYSEAMIKSPFLRRWRGDRLAEGMTHPDGVIGHFEFRSGTKTGLMIATDATQFVVTEAKVFALLSPGVTNADYYDQAARNVACIAWVIGQAGIPVENFESLGFYVIAPREQILEGVFSSQISKSSIKKKVDRRISAYSDDDRKYAELQTWYKNYFIPTLKHMEIDRVAWEDVVEAINEPDVKVFYSRCLKFNERAESRIREEAK